MEAKIEEKAKAAEGKNNKANNLKWTAFMQ